MPPLLEVKNIAYNYHTEIGETKAIKNVSFNLKKGEFISIVGPSGCGKSTLLSLISGLLKPSKGEIYIDNKKYDNQTNQSIGYMFQKDQLFEWRSIMSNTLLGLEIRDKLTIENKKYVEQLIKTYGLDNFKYHKPSQLSGGMRQRAALIRTLALKPEILLLDEPFSALDYQTRLKVSDEIWKILKTENKTALLVTHDIAEAISMSDKVIILTNRPAVIKKIVPIDFETDNRSPLLVRKIPKFQLYFDIIWKELDICNE